MHLGIVRAKTASDESRQARKSLFKVITVPERGQDSEFNSAETQDEETFKYCMRGRKWAICVC